MSYKIPEVPLWRVFFSVKRLLNNPINVIDDNLKRYGHSYAIRPGGSNRTVVTTNTELINHVLRKNHTNYEKSKLQTDELAQFLGHGLLTVNGSYWLQQRRLIQPGFHKKKLEALNNIMQSVVLRINDDISRRIESNNKIGLHSLMTEMTLHVVTQGLFSTGVDDDQVDKIGSDITTLQEAIIKNIRLPFLKWWRTLNGTNRMYQKLAQELFDLVMSIIQNRKNSTNESDDLLDMLLGVRYADTDQPMTDQQILEESIVLLVAGHETSANALTWLFYLLAQHPNELVKLRQEIHGVNKDHLTMEDAMSMKAISNAISEAMRLYPPAWITDRVALNDDQCGDIKIKKGEIVGPYIYGVHRDPQIWESPEEFIPDRFNDFDKRKNDGFAYLPFGGGPRLCIGQSFAMLEMQLIVFHLLKNYDFELIKGQEIGIMPLVTLRPDKEIWMNVTQR